MSGLKLSSNWLRGLLAACAVALTVAACGGGDGGTSARVGTGGTGAFSVGAITGFGSVIVNGLRFEDASARVSDEDGPRSRSDLKLGMVVKVEGSVSTSASPTGTATSIVFDSELLGPVKLGVNRAITVIGQKVALSSATVFDASLPGGAGLR